MEGEKGGGGGWGTSEAVGREHSSSGSQRSAAAVQCVVCIRATDRSTSVQADQEYQAVSSGGRGLRLCETTQAPSSH